MSDSSDRAKPASVAAFLFLPQFGSMFRNSSHIIPVLVRTVARLFVQAGLLPPTHPSALYGAPGVERCGFFRMMGDAWHMLRSTAATPYQWSIFCSVVLMIIVLTTSVISTLFSFSTFVSSASAQIFALGGSGGTGGGGSGILETDMAGMPSPGTPCTSLTPLCRVIPQAGTGYGDYAIDLLDKTLRLGANVGGSSGGQGGPLQNAVGALMQVYNSGILFVAACLLFWLIISVVVDIAKTGQVGGGRHNLVWAPIRIVFALGMMVPLGPSGFSSGQYVIMKIAEWGSNFGSNGWNAYISSVMKNYTNIVPALPLGSNLDSLAASYARMWVCRVAHNGYGYQSEGQDFIKPTTAQWVFLKPDTGTTDKGQMSYAYTNATANDLCGRVTFPTGMDPALLGQIQPGSNTVDPIAQQEAIFKFTLDQAWMHLFVSGYNPSPGNPGTPSTMSDAGLKMAVTANNFACDFVGQHIWGKVNGDDVLFLDCIPGGDAALGIGGGGGNYGLCGAGPPGSGQYPTMKCMDDPGNQMDTNAMTGIIGSAIAGPGGAATQAQQTLQNFVQSNPTAVFGQRGWADMATFYKQITTLTSTIKESLAIPVQISAPAVQDQSDNQSRKVQEVLGKYDDWLTSVPNSEAITPVANNCNNDPPAAGCPQWSTEGFNPFAKELGLDKAASGGSDLSETGKDGLQKLTKSAMTQINDFARDPFAMIMKPINKLTSGFEGTTFLGIPDPSDPAHVNDYPIQILSNVGILIIKMATTLAAAMTVVELGASMLPINLGVTFVSSLVAQMVDIFGDALMGAGFILVYYLPIMPYIRVAHAVLVWIVAVFEAVMLVPIACLAFLDTEKEGMYTKDPFLNWLDILVRPILTVIGYVGAVIVFDAFFGYLQSSFANSQAAEVADMGTMYKFVGKIVNTVIFCFLAYTAANTSFKMISMIPDAFFRWLPGGRAAGSSSWEAPNPSQIAQQMGGMASKGMNAPGQALKSVAQLRQQQEYGNTGNQGQKPPGTTKGT